LERAYFYFFKVLSNTGLINQLPVLRGFSIIHQKNINDVITITTEAKG